MAQKGSESPKPGLLLFEDSAGEGWGHLKIPPRSRDLLQLGSTLSIVSTC